MFSTFLSYSFVWLLLFYVFEVIFISLTCLFFGKVYFLRRTSATRGPKISGARVHLIDRQIALPVANSALSRCKVISNNHVDNNISLRRN